MAETAAKRLALIGIVVEERESAEALNQVLHDFAEFLVGRMGVPYPARNVSIISVIIDAPGDTVSSLSGRLGMIPGIRVKVLYSK